MMNKRKNLLYLSVEKPYVSADTVKKALGKPYQEDTYANGKAYRLIYLTGNQYVFIDGNRQSAVKGVHTVHFI